MEKLSIGVACYGPQEAKWWGHLARLIIDIGYTAEIQDVIVSDSMATDHNRNNIVKIFLESKSEWLFWIDADTIVPFGSVRRLLGTQKKIVSGLYYSKHSPHNAIAYYKTPEAYKPIDFDSTWERGELLKVDAVGMGCCLIHRSVFEEFSKMYIPMQEPNGSLSLMHKDDFIKDDKLPEYDFDEKVVGNYRMIKMKDVTLTNYKYPYFALEHGRTEDMWFFERIGRLGMEVWLDTSIECGHMRAKEFLGEEYRKMYGY